MLKGGAFACCCCCCSHTIPVPGTHPPTNYAHHFPTLIVIAVNSQGRKRREPPTEQVKNIFILQRYKDTKYT